MLTYGMAFVLLVLSNSRETFQPQYNAFYTAVPVKMDFWNATGFCNVFETELFVPESIVEYTDMIKRSGFEKSWIGIQGPERRSFLTVRGNYTPSSDPDNDKCIVLTNDNDFVEDTCYNKHAFICKRQNIYENGNEQSEPPIKRKLNENYTFFEEFNAFYKIHTVGQNFTNAVETCSAEGALLLIPKSSEESKAILDSSGFKYFYSWVGIHDMEEEGQFKTVEGVIIDNSKFNWKSGEPNDGYGNEDCVELTPENVYNDDDCSKNLLFICKKSADSTDGNKKIESEIDKKIPSSNEVESIAIPISKAEAKLSSQHLLLELAIDKEALVSIMKNEKEKDEDYLMLMNFLPRVKELQETEKLEFSEQIKVWLLRRGV